MFCRIFAISHGVRAYFAPEPSAFARRGARRAKNALENASGGLSITVFMNIQSFLHHAADRFRLHVRRPSIAHWNTNTYTMLSIFRPPPVPDHRAQRGEENFRVARRSVGISLFRARVRGLFPYFGAACRNTIISPACTRRAVSERGVKIKLRAVCVRPCTQYHALHTRGGVYGGDAIADTQ